MIEFEKEAEEYADKYNIMNDDLSPKSPRHIILEVFKDGYIAGAEAHSVKWHNLQENPTDLPQCKEDEQIIFYVKEWYENISKYRNHYCLGFYKKAFLNDDVKVFVEKSKGYENEHLPSTVLRWCELPKWEEDE